MEFLSRIKIVFRPVYVPIVTIKNELNERLKFEYYLSKNRGARAFIIGAPVYTNLGDSAILLAQVGFLQKCGYTSEQIKEITSLEYKKYRDLLKRRIKKSEPIYGLGGGNMGNQWPAEEQIRENLIEDYPYNNIIIFPQTIHFVANTEDGKHHVEDVYNRHIHITLVAREIKSYEIMRMLFSKATLLLTPDIVLSTTMDDYGAGSVDRSGILFVTRSDPEKSVADETWEKLDKYIASKGKQTRKTDMYSKVSVNKDNRVELVRQKMQEFCGAELVITDRLHGMVFAALTGTPCIVFSNYNHKVKGTYDWISYLPYIRYVETVEEAEAAIPELLEMKNCKYDNSSLLSYFEKLAEVVKEHTAD